MVVTFFSIPKPFIGHIGIIQRNAVGSWARLKRSCQIVLCGDEQGVKEACAEFGAFHLPNVAYNQFGTPLLDSAFSQSSKIAKNHFLCYVNSDIILFEDLLLALQQITFEDFLLIGRRTNVAIQELLDYQQVGGAAKLRDFANQYGTLHYPTGIDYMVFPRTSRVAAIPPFAVGRPAWDNWMVYRALQLRLPVIEATNTVMALHQQHDYQHVPQGKDNSWEGPEADTNRRLANWGVIDEVLPCTVDDANYVLTPSGFYYRSNWTRRLGRIIGRLLPSVLVKTLGKAKRRLLRTLRLLGRLGKRLINQNCLKDYSFLKEKNHKVM